MPKARPHESAGMISSLPEHTLFECERHHQSPHPVHVPEIRPSVGFENRRVHNPDFVHLVQFRKLPSEFLNLRADLRIAEGNVLPLDEQNPPVCRRF